MTRRPFALVLLCAVLFSGCTPAGEVPTMTPPAFPVSTPTPAPGETAAPIDVRIQSMTLEQKVGQLFLAGFSGVKGEAEGFELVSGYYPGGILLTEKNIGTPQELVALTNELKRVNSSANPAFPLFVALNHSGGEEHLMPQGVNSLPAPYEYRVPDPDDEQDRDERYAAAERMGTALAAACGAFGINLDFVPTVNRCPNPEQFFPNSASFGENNLANVVFRFLGGFPATGGVVPVAKYFPGLDEARQDPKDSYAVYSMNGSQIPWSPEYTQEPPDDFSNFYALWDCYTCPVLVSHIIFPGLDAENPITLSPTVLKTFFGGYPQVAGVYHPVLVCDDLNCPSVLGQHPLREAAVMAVEAGCDMVIVSGGEEPLSLAYGAVMEAVKSGRIAESRLDESLYRILTLKETYSLADRPVALPDLNALNELVKAAAPLAISTENR